MINHIPFDLSELDRFSFGDEEFKKELINIFIEQIPDFIANLNLYLEKQEWENFAREVHTAKSSVVIFGMHDTGRMLKELQILAEAGKTNDLPQLLDRVFSDLQQVLECLKTL
jgi:HPt (histidine-containing phosphotransfer) domain-containing protein